MASLGHMSQGAVGPDILGTGFVPASKAPLLDTTPAGDVEGLIGVGPLIASEKPFQRLFPSLVRPFTGLPQIF